MISLLYFPYRSCRKWGGGVWHRPGEAKCRGALRLRQASAPERDQGSDLWRPAQGSYSCAQTLSEPGCQLDAEERKIQEHFTERCCNMGTWLIFCGTVAYHCPDFSAAQVILPLMGIFIGEYYYLLSLSVFQHWKPRNFRRWDCRGTLKEHTTGFSLQCFNYKLCIFLIYIIANIFLHCKIHFKLLKCVRTEIILIKQSKLDIYNFIAEQSLHSLWRELVTLCGKKLFYNPFTGW